MRVVQQLDEALWRQYVEENPLGNIFHTPEMYRVFAQTKGYRPALWATLSDSGEPLALMLPVRISLMNGPVRRFVSRAVAYGSVLCNADAAGHEALACLLQTYRAAVGRSILFTELRNLVNLASVQPTLRAHGFVYEDHLNYLIDLEQPKERIWQKVSRRTRSYIRAGQRRDELCIREVDSQASLRQAYDLLRKTYANARVPLADISLFRGIFDVLRPRRMARISLVYWQDVPIATSFDLLYKGVVYYWYGGMDRAFGSLHASELLRWHVIEWAIDNGYRVFDFGGAGRPDEAYSVRDFKAKFGGDLVNLGRSAYVHSPGLLNLSKRGYAVYRRFLAAANRSVEAQSPV